MAQVIVNKSDTFEVQRQKINEIGYDLHTFSGTQIGLNATYITLTDISAVVNSAAAGGNLVYDNSTGQIVYTPPDLSNFITSIGDAIQDADFPSAGLMKTDGSGNYSVVTDNSANWIALTDIQVTNNTPSAGGSSLGYNNTTGVFSFTPQDVSTFITLADISVTQNSVGTAALSYNASTGVLTYTPPDLSSYLTGLPSHTHTLIGLTDTSLIGGDAPQDGEVLTYDATNTTWKAIAPGGNIPDLQDVCDQDPVTTTNITAGSVICSDAGQFSIGTSTYATLGYNAAGSKVIYNGNNSGLDVIADQLDYFSGSTKRATLNNSGLDVVGQIDTDGLEVDGDAWFQSASAEYLRWDKVNGCLYFYNAGLKDSTGTIGTADQVLTSTGNTVEWKTRTIENISNVNITAIQTNQILKWDGTEWVNALDSGGSGGGIALGDLTVGTEGSPSGNGGLSYNNLTGQFTFTPAADNSLAFNHANATTSQIIYTNNGAGTPYTLNLKAGTGITFGQGGGNGELTITGTSGIALTDLSVGSEGSASGDGAIAYNDTTGVFTYTPPDLSGYLQSYTETDTLDDVAGRGATTDKNITLTGTSSFPGRFDVQNNGNYAISLNATAGVGINTADGVGLYIGNLATNVWRASISGSTGDITSSGDITGDSFIKDGGTSSQFLKADGSVDSSTYLTAVSLASSALNDLSDVNAGTPTDGHVLKWDDSSSKWISAADGGGSGGSAAVVAELDQWEMTTGMSSEDDQDGQGNPTIATADGRKILNNIVNDSNTSASVAARSAAPFAKLGNGMSVDSSGLWTFPTTGKWEVTFAAQFQSSGNISGGAGNGYETSTVDIYIETTTDTGSNWSNAAQATDNTLRHFHQGKDKTSQFCKALIDITDVATDKIRFKVNATANGTIASGKGSIMSFAKADASGGGVQLADLSVTTNAAGTAALAYNTGTGVFSYTPPDLSAVSTDLTAFSVGSNATASGGGGLGYNNSTGVFTYTPPDLSSYITGLAVNELADVTISSPQNGHVLKYNGTSWENGPDATGSGNADNIAENNTKVETIDTGGGTGKITFDIEGTQAVEIDANRQILISGTQTGNNVAKIFNDTDGAGTGVLGIYASSNNASPRDVRIYSGGGTANEIFRAGKDGQIGVGGDVGSNGQILTSGGATGAASWQNQVTPGIQLTALSVTQNSAGTAGLSYNNVSGVFTYTPPNVSSFISLGSLSVGSPQTASGDGAISYNSTNGVFSYTPPDLSAHLTTSSVIANLSDVVITGSPQSGQVLKWDNATSKWTNQADAQGAGGTSAAGSAMEIQFNDGSAGFAASSKFKYDSTTNANDHVLTLDGEMKLAKDSTTTGPGGGLKIGASGELELFHSTNATSCVRSTGGVFAIQNQHQTGNNNWNKAIQLQAYGDIQLRHMGGADAFTSEPATGQVKLFYSGALALTTDDGGIRIEGGLFDKDNDLGSSGQYLKSTGTEIEWTTPPTGAEILSDLTDVVITGSPADDQVLAWDNGTSKWTNQTPTGGDSFPSGGIIMWSGTASNIPSGWVLCNGNNNTPDLRDRFVLGAGSTYDPEDTGGQETVTISTSQMPSHTHTVNSHSHSIPSHSHTVGSHTHSIGSHTHSFSGSGTGTSGVQSQNHHHSGNTSDAGVHNHSYVTHSALYTGDYHTEAVNANMGNVAATTGDAGTHAHYFDTLGVSQDHTHDTTVSISGTTGGGSGSTGSASPSTSTNGSTNTGTSTASTTGTGNGSSVNIMPKYFALCYIMKT